MTKQKYLKSPMNYIGGKHKLLPQIIPLFPDNINTFYDVFGGGGNVFINTEAKKYKYNDIVYHVVDMFEDMNRLTPELAIKKVESIIDKYELSKTNREGFNQLREDYNNGHNDWSVLYTLISYSFNYQFRFNNDHEYNSSFGKNRSQFTNNMRKRLYDFIEKVSEIDIEFSRKDFRELGIEKLDLAENDLLYFDPPYLISTGNYNDGKRGFSGWSEQEEKDLLELLDKIDEKGSRFALSNVLKHKGRSNSMLKEWSNKYNVHFLNADYTNSNYQNKDRDKSETVEVLITNY